MIVDATRAVSYKCPYCGAFVFGEISIFELMPGRVVSVVCECGESEISISRPKKGYLFEVPCVACEDDHEFRVTHKELWGKDDLYISCPENGFTLCCVGSKNAVETWVEQYDENMETVLGELGIEDYFVNDTIMLETVDRIHDIAENGRLYCNCGTMDIEMELLYDRIVLVCPNCNAEKEIIAETDEDLENFKRCEEIVLSSCDDGQDRMSKVITLSSLK